MLRIVGYIFVFLAVSVSAGAQVKSASGIDFQAKGLLDSLSGFDSLNITKDLAGIGLSKEAFESKMTSIKRLFVKTKFMSGKNVEDNVVGSVTPSSTMVNNKMQLSSGGNINSITNCNNLDFEATIAGTYTNANAVNGWSVSSNIKFSCLPSTGWQPGSNEFSVLYLPVTNIPGIGTLSVSPFGGNTIVRLNDYFNNNYVTRLSRSFSVTPGNTVLRFAMAAVLQDGGHQCCEQSLISIQMATCQGSLIACLSNSASATPPCFSHPQYTNTTGAGPGNLWYGGWKIFTLDLSPYLNSCVELSVIANDCMFGGHWCSAFFDATCTPPDSTYFSQPSQTGYVASCPGTTTAILQAPQGFFSYQWFLNTNLTINQATTSILNVVSNSSLSNFYTVTYNNGNPQCQLTKTYTVSPTQVFTTGIISSNTTCSVLPAGASTVIAIGSNLGYNYTWLNSTNSVVSTASVANNLLPGVYSVNISVPGSPACGTAQATTTISVISPIISNSYIPYCNNMLYIPPKSGSNFQWYINQSPVTASLGGTSPGFSAAVTNSTSIYVLTSINPIGCKDSTIYLIFPSSPATISNTIIPSAPICPDYPVNIVLSIPTPGQGLYTISYSVSSINAPVSFSNTSGPLSTGNYTLGGLLAGYSYSIIAFNGCYSSSTINIPSNMPSPNYTITPLTASVCSGSSVGVQLSFTTSPTNVLWSPGPITQTMHLSSFNATYVPTASPGTSVINVHTVSTKDGICTHKRTFTITTFGSPILMLSASNSLICLGESATLSVNGATSYSWNTSSNNSIIVVSPGISTTYWVLGTDSLSNCQSMSGLNIYVDQCLKIEEKAFYSGTRIYPTIVYSELVVESLKRNSFEIYNSAGNIVMQGSCNAGNNKLDLSDIFSGFYCIKITNDIGGKEVFRFFKAPGN